MEDEPDNVVLQLLRAIRNDIGSLRAEVKENAHEFRVRLSTLWQQYASLSYRLDRVVESQDRILKRLELVD